MSRIVHRVNSFDIFDTLIARRCISPKEIFAELESESGIQGFSDTRVKAEASLEPSEYSIDDIYESVGTLTGIDSDRLESLKQRELELELENVIPIVENLSQVQNGDILVSDMYLDEDQIHSLLMAAGLEADVTIRVSGNGKHTGRMWQTLGSEFAIGSHLGDNLHSDVRMARKHGISARLTKAHAVTATEQAYLDAGLPLLARLCREVRLDNWHPDSQIRHLQQVQAGLNLPFLLVASIWLTKQAEAAGVQTVLMSSRDCNVWHDVFNRTSEISSSQVSSEYFFTSRIARVFPSETYRKYALAKLGAGSLWVDLCGTGHSMRELLASLGVSELKTHLAHQLPVPGSSAQPVTSPLSNQEIEPLVHPFISGVANGVLEMCNQATHPMIVDVKPDGDAFSPVFAPDRRSEETLSAVAAQVDVANLFIARISRAVIDEITLLSPNQQRDLSIAIYRLITLEQATIRNHFQVEHVTEDKAVSVQLGLDSQQFSDNSSPLKIIARSLYEFTLKSLVTSVRRRRALRAIVRTKLGLVSASG